MKTRTRLAISLTVAAMPIGFSAFKSTYVPVTYYRVSGNATSTSASDYQYRPNGECGDGDGNCSFTVNLANTPTENSNPTQAQVNSATITEGQYTE